MLVLFYQATKIHNALKSENYELTVLLVCTFLPIYLGLPTLFCPGSSSQIALISTTAFNSIAMCVSK